MPLFVASISVFEVSFCVSYLSLHPFIHLSIYVSTTPQLAKPYYIKKPPTRVPLSVICLIDVNKTSNLLQLWGVCCRQEL